MGAIFTEHRIDRETIIADNSTDNTQESTKSMGAKSIVPDKHDYKNAYRLGFEHVSADYIVMGDGDNTYEGICQDC